MNMIAKTAEQYLLNLQKNIKLLAVGGVNDGNMKDYLDAGVCGFGIGSNIVDKKLLNNNDFEGITELAKRYVSAIRGC